MAFHYLSGYSHTLIQDPFVADVGGEYLFNGVTLKDGHLVPNLIGWDICFSLGVNRSIGFSKETVALFVDGQVRAQTKHLLERAISFHRPLPREYAKGLLYPSGSRPISPNLSYFWSLAKEQLTKASGLDENAAKILAAITNWEESSERTLRWLLNEKMKPDLPKERIEIIVSDTHWLLRDRAENRLAVGEFENIWGEIHIPKGEEIIRLAAPVKNGWFIEAPDGNRYLLLRNGNSIGLQDVYFPHGKWIRHGNWTFWIDACVLLTPAGRIFAVPSNTRVLGASSHWFFFSAFSNLIVVDQEGKIFEKKIPRQLGRKPQFFIGDNSMLIARRGKKYHHFSVVNVSDQPFRRRLWESAVDYQDAQYHVGVIRSNPDIFVVILEAPIRNALGIWFIDGLGRIGHSPLFIKWDVGWPTLDLKDMGGGYAIVRLDWVGKLTEIEVKAASDQVQINMGGGVVLACKMVPFPTEEKKTLLEILEDARSLYGLW